MRKRRRRARRPSAAQRPLEKAVFYILLFIIAMNQLAFGGIYQASQTATITLCTTCALLLLIDVLLKLRNQEQYAKDVLPLPPTYALVSIGIFTLYPLMQLLPVPESILKIISTDSHNAWHTLKEQLPEIYTYSRISIDPYRTLHEYIKFIPAVFIFFASLAVIKSDKDINKFALFVIALSIFQALYGTYQVYSDEQSIWWYKTVPYKGFVTGTYINRNHLAGFLELGIPLAIAFALWRSKKHLKQITAKTPKLLITDWLYANAIFIIPLILISTLVLTGSRGGILALTVSSTLLAITHMKKRVHILLVILALIAILIAMSFINFEKTLTRFENKEDFFTRVAIYKSCLPMLWNNVIAGIGLGNFNEAYSVYALPQFAGLLSLKYAHNDWLQPALELGTLGIIACTGLTFFVFRTLWQGKDSHGTSLYNKAFIVSFTSLAMHNIFDFNFHIPANIFVCSLIAAIAFKLSAKSATRQIKLGPNGLRIAIFTLLCTMSIFTFVTAKSVQAYRAHTIYRSTATLVASKSQGGLKTIDWALKHDLDNPALYRALAHKYLFFTSNNHQLQNISNARSRDNIKEALKRQPANERNWYYLLLQKTFGATFQDPAELERRCSTILAFAPNNPHLSLQMAKVLHFYQGRFTLKNTDKVRYRLQYSLIYKAAQNTTTYEDYEFWMKNRNFVTTLIVTPDEKKFLVENTTNKYLRNQFKRWVQID